MLDYAVHCLTACVAFVFLSQLGGALAGRDGRWHCGRSYEMQLAGGRVHLFFIDTNPFVMKYYDTEWANFTGGKASAACMLCTCLADKCMSGCAMLCLLPPAVSHADCSQGRAGRITNGSLQHSCMHVPGCRRY